MPKWKVILMSNKWRLGLAMMLVVIVNTYVGLGIEEATLEKLIALVITIIIGQAAVDTGKEIANGKK